MLESLSHYSNTAFKKRPYTILSFLLFILFILLIPRPKNFSSNANLTSPSSSLHDFELNSIDTEEVEYTPLTKSQLLNLVGKNPSYLVKDSHASFGWNNIRFMIETTLILSKISNRIPILPESIWCRKCNVASEICTKNSLRYFASRNSHMDELGLKWNEDGQAWKISIEHFLDLPHLRATYGPFLLTTEFHLLYDLPLETIEGSGHFNASTQVPSSLKLSILPNKDFESPSSFVRVDRPNLIWEEGKLKADQGRGRLNRINMTSLLNDTGKIVWKVEEIREVIKRSAGDDISRISQEELDIELEEIGIVGLFTFSDQVIMNKALVTPSIEYTFLRSIRPFSSLPTSSFSTNSILYIPGDLHDLRHPGAIRFTTASARQQFIDIVQKTLRGPKGIREAGKIVVGRIKERVGGRGFVGAHSRRGDFLGLEGWSSEKDPITHFEKTKKALSIAYKEVALRSSKVEAPLLTDPFYLATDETSPPALQYYRSNQALLLSDLISVEELNQLIGPTSSFTDVLSLVEQHILADSEFFVGSKFSSTTGGILNLREGNGKGSWSWLLL